jgi:site-specific recombinase XerC
MAALKAPKLMARIPKERDLEAHVRIQHIFGDDFVEVRDFIPSTKTYSRGFLIDMKLLPRLNEELQRIEQERFGKTSPVGAGQGKLF